MARKLIKKGNTVYEILELLSYATEISPKIFHTQKRNYKVYMNEVKKMTNNHTYINEYGEMVENIKALTVIGKGPYKTIRLRLKAYEEKLLALLSDDLQSRYKINSFYRYQDHYNVKMIKRNHVLSQLYTIFNKNNIRDNWLNQKDKIKIFELKDGLFINSRLIKSRYPSKAIKNHGRAYGFLLYPTACHTVYYYENLQEHWKSESEKRSKYLAQKVINDNFEISIESEGFCNNAIIISRDNKLAIDLLKNKKIMCDSTKQCLHLDNTYQNCRYINIQHIDEMLYILKHESFINQKVKREMFGEKQNINRSIDCDGITEDKKIWLFTFDFNLIRIRRFKKNIDYYEEQRFAVYGFDWQKKFLLNCFKNERVDVFTIDFKTLMEIIEEGDEK